VKVHFRKSFLRDLKRLTQEDVKVRLRQVIESIEHATSLREIANLKKLKFGEEYYRIRLGDYRLGLIAEGESVVLVRFLHRRELYRYFP